MGPLYSRERRIAQGSHLLYSCARQEFMCLFNEHDSGRWLSLCALRRLVVIILLPLNSSKHLCYENIANLGDSMSLRSIILTRPG
jgi:hypothetical protein